MCFSVLCVDWLAVRRWGGGMKGDWTECWWRRCALCIHARSVHTEGEGRMEKKARNWLSGQTKSFLYKLQSGKEIMKLKSHDVLGFFPFFLLNLVSPLKERNNALVTHSKYESDLFLFVCLQLLHKLLIFLVCMHFFPLEYIRLRTCLGSRCFYLVCVHASVCVFI